MQQRLAGLRQAVPYLRMFGGTIFVIKLGGEIFADEEALANVVDQVAVLHQVGIKVVMVHGGGPQATEMSHKLGVPTEMVNGRRVTTAPMLEVAKMVYNGTLNTNLLAQLRRQHVASVGLSGIDGGLIHARRRPVTVMNDAESNTTRTVDFGYVGDVVAVEPALVHHLLAGGYVPVVSSMAGSDDGEIYNVNADTIAVCLAAALHAEKVILLTSTCGVLHDPEDATSIISHMTLAQMEARLPTIAGGMRAKLEACRYALQHGVPRTHIISGLKRDTLLVEVFTNEGSGTLIEQETGEEPCSPGVPKSCSKS